ncbi:MAG TPA: class I SAM-dependent methyltransferase [Bacteroidales bacterium]|nr:class I SAM-dependent methyltransferase [Bacteroidales bacterium]
MVKYLKVLRNPIWAIKRIKEKYLVLPAFKRKHISSLKKLLKGNGYDFNEFEESVDEFNSFSEIHNFVNSKFVETGIKSVFPPDKYSWGCLLYFIIRKTKPDIIVETGCWYGNSSTIILAALFKNQRGKLFTIDLPALFETGGYYDENPYRDEEMRTSSLPRGKAPGFIVPDFLKNRWELIYGQTSEKLLPLLEELGEIDIFLHDSLHSIENMNFEFNLAYKYLKNRGILASDNIDWNNVFKDFSLNKKSCSYLAYYESPLLKDNFGIIIKD